MFGKFIILSLMGILAVSALSPKIEPRLANSIASKGTSNVFVRFSGNKAALSAVASQQFSSRGEKITNLVAALEANAQRSQRSLLTTLSSSVEMKSYWINNELYIKGADAKLLEHIATLPEVTKIYEERVAEVIKSVSTSDVLAGEWGIEKIEADAAWALPGGNNGQGVVVSNIDTGVRGTHEALRGNYRQDYGWFDPITRSQTPVDDQGHGSHTMGTIAGSNGIGVAPGAQWVACKGCNAFGGCPQADLIACAEWTLCPTRPDGTDRDCSKAPSVSSNSWGYAGGNDDFYQEIVAAWIAADIVPVFAAGNEGSCNRLRSPGDYANVLTVGSTDSSDMLSSFSSGGPGRNNQIKPEISAPGSAVRSAGSGSDTSYAVLSGTSMATPHIAGVTALLQSRNPNLTVTEIIDLLTENVDTQSLGNTGTVCGGKDSTTFPNNQYGHGRVNARKSLEAAINA